MLKDEAIKSCQEVLDMDQNAVDAHCDLAELHLADNLYEKGKSSVINPHHNVLGYLAGEPNWRALGSQLREPGFKSRSWWVPIVSSSSSC